MAADESGWYSVWGFRREFTEDDRGVEQRYDLPILVPVPPQPEAPALGSVVAREHTATDGSRHLDYHMLSLSDDGLQREWRHIVVFPFTQDINGPSVLSAIGEAQNALLHDLHAWHRKQYLSHPDTSMLEYIRHTARELSSNQVRAYNDEIDGFEPAFTLAADSGLLAWIGDGTDTLRTLKPTIKTLAF